MPPKDINVLIGAALTSKEVEKIVLSGNITVQGVKDTTNCIAGSILPQEWTLTQREIDKLNAIKADTLQEFAQGCIRLGLTGKEFER